MNSPSAAPGLTARWLQRTVSARGMSLGIIALAAGGWLWSSHGADELPDFTQHDNTVDKKEAFFAYLLPHIRSVNTQILAERKRLRSIRDQLIDDDSAGFFDDRWLIRLAGDYGLEPPEVLSEAFANQLLRRVDIIPPSLVLAQAANESAWGTSRFARHGNNLFGMRTYDGDGIVPRRRAAGKKFQVAVYDTVRESIGAYADNLNTHYRYRSMRQIRASLRRQGQPVTGLALSNGLLAYSTRGSEYVDIIQSIIRSNNLEQYDE
ncbi:MAG: glucosaminidase domain-containing protein [Cephaloticoccus sp.]|nr:glucosaminidase domain-containing protein [Cephaloticoccus sp.]